MKNTAFFDFSLAEKWVWLKRIRRCKGFSVQSPWAYDLVVNVINNHTELPEYLALRRKYPNIPFQQRRHLELLLRLVRKFCPASVICLTGGNGTSGNGSCAPVNGSNAIRDYLLAGRPINRFQLVDSLAAVDWSTAGGRSVNGRTLVHIVDQEGCEAFFQEAARRLRGADPLFVIYGINSSQTMRRLWLHVKERQEGCVTFDLYYSGLAFFDSKRFKQNYVINF